MRILGFGALLGVALLVVGCPTAQPPPEAVLEGDWETTVDLVAVTITFNDQGVVVQVAGEAEGGTTATVAVSGATTVLDGSDVTITIPVSSGDVVFDGTLSSDENTMTGTINRSINIGDDIIVNPPAGDLTLVRAGTGDPCDNVTCDAGETCVDGECVSDGGTVCEGADASAGETFVADNCAACHGADGASGFAPDIQCKSAAEIEAALGGLAVHAAITAPTADELCDIEAYLNSFDACTSQ